MKKTELITVLLPSVCPAVIGLLIFISFASLTVSRLIMADKLILLSLALSLLVWISGLTVSIKGLFTIENKKTTLKGLFLNLILLSTLVYFSKPFLVELQFILLRM